MSEPGEDKLAKLSIDDKMEENKEREAAEALSNMAGSSNVLPACSMQPTSIPVQIPTPTTAFPPLQPNSPVNTFPDRTSALPMTQGSIPPCPFLTLAPPPPPPPLPPLPPNRKSTQKRPLDCSSIEQPMMQHMTNRARYSPPNRSMNPFPRITLEELQKQDFKKVEESLNIGPLPPLKLAPRPPLPPNRARYSRPNISMKPSPLEENQRPPQNSMFSFIPVRPDLSQEENMRNLIQQLSQNPLSFIPAWPHMSNQFQHSRPGGSSQGPFSISLVRPDVYEQGNMRYQFQHSGPSSSGEDSSSSNPDRPNVHMRNQFQHSRPSSSSQGPFSFSLVRPDVYEQGNMRYQIQHSGPSSSSQEHSRSSSSSQHPSSSNPDRPGTGETSGDDGNEDNVDINLKL